MKISPGFVSLFSHGSFRDKSKRRCTQLLHTEGTIFSSCLYSNYNKHRLINTFRLVSSCVDIVLWSLFRVWFCLKVGSFKVNLLRVYFGWLELSSGRGGGRGRSPAQWKARPAQPRAPTLGSCQYPAGRAVDSTRRLTAHFLIVRWFSAYNTLINYFSSTFTHHFAVVAFKWRQGVRAGCFVLDVLRPYGGFNAQHPRAMFVYPTLTTDLRFKCPGIIRHLNCTINIIYEPSWRDAFPPFPTFKVVGNPAQLLGIRNNCSPCLT
jgi:hypothetical protein